LYAPRLPALPLIRKPFERLSRLSTRIIIVFMD
jgi:hypothetical protein